jgi:hypothetical protein
MASQNIQPSMVQHQYFQDWKNAVIIPIWKQKGSKRDCSQYRGISRLSHSGKLFCKIIERRLRHIIEQQLSEAQMGFRKKLKVALMQSLP